MLVAALRFVGLFLTALVTGTAFCQMLEGSGRAELASEQWLAVQQTLYSAFDLVSGLLQGAALLATAIVAVMVRHRRRTLALNAIAFFCLAMMIVVSAAWLSPIAGAVSGWTPHTVP